MKAYLQKKTRLTRTFTVETEAGGFTVRYNGLGAGYEEVRVNNKVAAKVRSWILLMPRIDFFIGPYSAVIEVKPSLWLSIRSFTFIVDGEILYSE